LQGQELVVELTRQDEPSEPPLGIVAWAHQRVVP
jgi:hypothetical protein